MFRPSWVNPQGDSFMCGVVCFTCISVSCIIHHNCTYNFLPEDEPKRIEKLRRKQKLQT